MSCLLLAGVAGAAERDRFTDGSGRSGPEFVEIPGGDYYLGSEPEEPGYFPHDRLHLATLSPFTLTAREITNDEFAAFLNEEGNKGELGMPRLWANDAAGIAEAGGKFKVKKGYGRRPVVSVSWDGARAYAKWLGKKTGKRYELPTAAQWEAGARGGSHDTWFWGPAFEDGHGHAGSSVTQVGSYPPNGYGLYDTAGNAWEWTLDCLELDSHRFAPRRDPSFFDAACRAPEVRGGSFRDGGYAWRPGRRLNYWWTGGANDSVGFRLARESSKPLPPAAPARRVKPSAAPPVPGLELALDTPATGVPLSFILFVEGREPVHALGGETMRLSLPPGKTKVLIKEADLGSSVERVVKIHPRKPTRLRLTAEDFRLPEPGRKTLEGRVLLSNHAPVKNALVVLGDYPARYETRTDAKGFYRFERVRDAYLPLFVDLREAGLPPGYPPAWLTRGDLSALSRAVIRPVPGRVQDQPSSGKRLDYATNVVGVWDKNFDRYVNIGQVTPNLQRAQLTIDLLSSGDFTVFWARYPLNVCTGGDRVGRAGPYTFNMDCRARVGTIKLAAKNLQNQAVSVAAYISSFAFDPDPYEVDTSAGGWIDINGVNVGSFNVWVDEAAGCYSGEIRIDNQNQAVIPLKAPGTCYDDP